MEIYKDWNVWIWLIIRRVIIILVMSQAHQKLKQYEIIECYAFKQFNLVQKIEKFINECLNNNNSLQTNHK